MADGYVPSFSRKGFSSFAKIADFIHGSREFIRRTHVVNYVLGPVGMFKERFRVIRARNNR